MKILFVAMSDSIHTARWIEQITNQGWDLHLFHSIEIGQTHPELKNVTVYHTVYKPNTEKKTNVKNKGFPIFSKDLATVLAYGINLKCRHYRIKKLIRLIKTIKPDIIHTMEIQQAGYLVNEVKKNFKGEFPKWIVTNWGSDVYLFGRLKEHRTKIKEVLKNCDYYSCECNRDVCLAKDYGFQGKSLPVFPNTGGFDIKNIIVMRNKIKPSKRKIIIVKGYQGWSGRSLVALRSLERCADLLNGYEIYLYSVHANTGVDIAAELFTVTTGISVKIIPLFSSHKTILKYQSRARIYLGLGISDAISTSLLESIAMGSFPIQSNTSCANEWIEDGKSGIIVPPEDPEIIEKALRKALTDDKLVNAAAKINWQVVRKRLDKKILSEEIDNFYKKVMNSA